MNLGKQIKEMNPKLKSVLFIIGLIIIGIVVGQIIGMISAPYLLEGIEGRDYHGPPPQFELSEDQKQAIITGFTNVSMILCSEIMLILGLIYVFIQTYRQTRSRYLIGFLLFVSVFFIKTVAYFLAMTPLITSSVRAAPIAINPLFRGSYGPFGIYFTLLEIIAISILIYISRE